MHGLRRLPFLDLPRGLCFSDARQWLPFTQIFAPEKAKYLAEEALIVLLFSVLLLALIDVDNIIVSSQFLLEVIFSPSSSILKWCSINADSSSRPILFFICRAAGRPSFSSFVVPPGDHLFLLLWRRRATIHFFISCAARRPSISSFPRAAGRLAKSNLFQFADGRSSRIIAPTGNHQESSRRRAIINNHRADGRLSTIIAPTCDHHTSSCRRAILIYCCVDGRSSNLRIAPIADLVDCCFNGRYTKSSFAPTGNLQTSSCHRAIFNNIFMPTGDFQSSRADGRF